MFPGECTFPTSCSSSLPAESDHPSGLAQDRLQSSFAELPRHSRAKQDHTPFLRILLILIMSRRRYPSYRDLRLFAMTPGQLDIPSSAPISFRRLCWPVPRLSSWPCSSSESIINFVLSQRLHFNTCGKSCNRIRFTCTFNLMSYLVSRL